MRDIEPHDLLAGESNHMNAQLISDQLDELIEFFCLIVAFILLDFDEFDGELGEDDLADVEVDFGVDEGGFVLEVTQVAGVLADGVKHAHELFDEVVALELLGGRGHLKVRVKLSGSMTLCKVTERGV